MKCSGNLILLQQNDAMNQSLTSSVDAHKVKTRFLIDAEFSSLRKLSVSFWKNAYRSTKMFHGIVKRKNKRKLLLSSWRMGVLNFQSCTFPFKYLGIPMAASRLTVVQDSPLLDGIRNAIDAWPSKTLSYAGKLELISSVIQGKAFYWLNLFGLPSAVVHSIEREYVWIPLLCRKGPWKKP